MKNLSSEEWHAQFTQGKNIQPSKIYHSPTSHKMINVIMTAVSHIGATHSKMPTHSLCGVLNLLTFLIILKLVDILYLMNHSKLLRELMFRNIAYLITITYQSTRPFHIIWKACRYLNESIQNSQNEIYAFFQIVPKTGNYRHHLTDRYQPNQRRCWIYWTSHKSENIFWPDHFHILVK